MSEFQNEEVAEECEKEISRIFCHWTAHAPFRFPSSTRNETRAPIHFEYQHQHPDPSNVAKRVESETTATVFNAPSSLDASTSSADLGTTLFEQNMKADLPCIPEPPPATEELYQYVSPYRTTYTQTSSGVVFVIERTPPVNTAVEIRMMPWGVLYYTSTTPFRKPLRAGNMLKTRGMLTGLWEVDKNLYQHDDYAFLQIMNHELRLVALIAVFRELVDMLEPSGEEDERRNILTGGWDIRQLEGKTYRQPNSVIQKHVTSAIGGQTALRWEAIESPVTYALQSSAQWGMSD
ncbi:hypothetical protein B0H13DRAFT_2353007 [Mycena leptocephala]|nr:hypothetical protein B0H13DRAFT_2353007 [Mycena leptocephala]